MSRRGRRVGWAVIAVSSAIIVGYLVKYGGPSYARSAGLSPALAAVAAPMTPTHQPIPAVAVPVEKVTPAPVPGPVGKAPQRVPAAGVPVPRPPAEPRVIAPLSRAPEPASAQPPRVEPSAAPGIDPSQAPADAPRITFEALEHDFGVVYQEESRRYDFAFRNTGQSPLKLGNIHTSCGGCVVTKSPEKEIAPGEKSVLGVTFDTGLLRGKVTKHVFINSNDPVRPRTVLAVKAEVKVEVEIQPGGIFFRRLAPGESVQRSLLLVPAEVKQFRVLKVEISDRHITLVTPVEKLKPGPDGTYTLTFGIGPFTEAKRVDEKVKITMGLKHRPVQTVSIYGFVAKEPPALPAPNEKQFAP